MPQFIQQFTHELIDDNGVIYTASVYGEPRADGTWEGWIEFNPLNSSQPTLRTPRETTQPDRSALAYWASGLEPLYLEGAFERAKR
ncbi:MAG TPA: hypothetical protein VLD57_08045, partial [Blastocatellia bacterium]|nr:hypothetical protein [Blastocatellia bacterium]